MNLRLNQLSFAAILLVATTILSSCDPLVNRSFVVINETTSELTILCSMDKGYVSITTPQDSLKMFAVESGSSAEIAEYGEIGSSRSAPRGIFPPFSVVILRDGVSYNVERLTDQTEWNPEILINNLFKIDEVEYLLIIHQSDFDLD